MESSESDTSWFKRSLSPYFKLESVKEQLKKKYICRNTEIDTLLSLFGEPQDQTLPCLMIYGHSSTGKTSILLDLLSLLDVKHSVTNCIEAFTSKLLFEPIIENFLGKERCQNENIKCDSMMQFVNLLKEENSSNNDFTQTLHVIVLETCNKLSEIQLQAFARLSELTEKQNLCCIMITQIVPSQFNFNYPVFTVVFPQYSKQELLALLLRDRPEKHPEEFYKNFLNIFLSFFLQVCRDLKELKSWVKIAFEKYIEPVRNNEMTYEDKLPLYRAVTPYFKKIINCIYLGTDFEIKGTQESQFKSSDVAIDLPFYTKFLLIAAYLASFNAPKYDKRLYLKEGGKVKRRAAIKLPTDKSIKQILGPRVFPLHRLLAIFYAIQEDKVNLTVNIYSQIASLIELRLLMRVNSDNLDEPKFKTTASFSCVENAGKLSWKPQEAKCEWRKAMFTLCTYSFHTFTVPADFILLDETGRESENQLIPLVERVAQDSFKVVPAQLERLQICYMTPLKPMGLINVHYLVLFHKKERNQTAAQRK